MLASLYANPALIWLGLAAAILAVEVLTGSGWLLWASASAAAIAGVEALTGGLSWPVALGGFSALTIASTLTARRFLPKAERVQGGDINDNASRLVGQTGRAVTVLKGRSGRVFVDGKEWAAELQGAATAAAGSSVLVVAVEGAVLKVSPAPA